MGDEPIRREYEREIAPRTVAALEAIFARVPLPAPSRVLDLGAGTGAVGQVVRARFPEAELVAVDKVPAPGVLCADVTRGLRPARVEGRFTLMPVGLAT